jgi:hypothetical protein
MESILASIIEGLNIRNYDDWLVFVDRLTTLTESGRIRKISPLPNRRFEKNDEWYCDPKTGEIYVHGLPNAPILPVWERFDLLEDSKAPETHPNNLSVIPTGKISRLEAKNLGGLLDFLVQQGFVEALNPSNVADLGGYSEKWYKDLLTGTIYRLLERDDEDNCWEKVPEGELRMKLQ